MTCIKRFSKGVCYSKGLGHLLGNVMARELDGALEALKKCSYEVLLAITKPCRKKLDIAFHILGYSNETLVDISFDEDKGKTTSSGHSECI